MHVSEACLGLEAGIFTALAVSGPLIDRHCGDAQNLPTVLLPTQIAPYLSTSHRHPGQVLLRLRVSLCLIFSFSLHSALHRLPIQLTHHPHLIPYYRAHDHRPPSSSTIFELPTSANTITGTKMSLCQNRLQEERQAWRIHMTAQT